MENEQANAGAATVAEYLTPQEAAAKKGVALASIYKAIERGQMPSERVFGRVVLRVSDVEAYTPGTYTRQGGETIARAAIKRGPGRPKITKGTAE